MKQSASFNYKSFNYKFNKNLHDNDKVQLRNNLNRQDKVMSMLLEHARSCQKYGNRHERLEKFKELLDTEEINDDFGTFTNIKPTMFMLDPSRDMTGIVVEKTYLFKSAMMPALLYFKVTLQF